MLPVIPSGCLAIKDSHSSLTLLITLQQRQLSNPNNAAALMDVLDDFVIAEDSRHKHEFGSHLITAQKTMQIVIRNSAESRRIICNCTLPRGPLILL